MRGIVGLLLLLVGCDDHLFGEMVQDEDAPEVDGYAGVQQIVATNCLGCHDTVNQLGGLDLETDLHGATVGVVGQYTIPIVQPGEPDGSMLYLKVTDAQPPNTGTDMPPGAGGLPLSLTSVIRDWIASGAPDGTGAVTDTSDTGGP